MTKKRLAYAPRNMYIVNMNDIRFEWDEGKNQENRRKHGVSFEEAQTLEVIP